MCPEGLGVGSLVPSVASLRCGNSTRQAEQREVFGSLGCALERDSGTLPLPLSGHEVSSLLYYNALPCHRHKSNGPADHGLEPTKQWATVHLPLAEGFRHLLEQQKLADQTQPRS